MLTNIFETDDPFLKHWNLPQLTTAFDTPLTANSAFGAKRSKSLKMAGTLGSLAFASAAVTQEYLRAGSSYRIDDSGGVAYVNINGVEYPFVKGTFLVLADQTIAVSRDSLPDAALIAFPPEASGAQAVEGSQLLDARQFLAGQSQSPSPSPSVQPVAATANFAPQAIAAPFSPTASLAPLQVSTQSAQTPLPSANTSANTSDYDDDLFGDPLMIALGVTALVGIGALIWWAVANSDPATETADPDALDFELTSGFDKFVGTDADETFGGLAEHYSNTFNVSSTQESFDGAGGNDQFIFDFVNQTDSRILSGSAISNIETYRFKNFDTVVTNPLAPNSFGMVGITSGTSIKFDDVTTLSNQTINNVTSALFYAYAPTAATAGTSFGVAQNGITVISNTGTATYVLTLENAAYSNAQMAPATSTTKIEVEITSGARGDVKIFGYNAANMDLDLSLLGLSVGNFSSVQSMGNTFPSRVVFATSNDVLYIDQNNDGLLNAANDLTISFVGLAGDLTANDFTF